MPWTGIPLSTAISMYVSTYLRIYVSTYLRTYVVSNCLQFARSLPAVFREMSAVFYRLPTILPSVLARFRRGLGAVWRGLAPLGAVFRRWAPFSAVGRRFPRFGVWAQFYRSFLGRPDLLFSMPPSSPSISISLHISIPFDRPPPLDLSCPFYSFCLVRIKGEGFSTRSR